MGSNNTAFTQSAIQQLEVRLLEERFCGSLRVRAVGDDDVEFVLVVGQELEAVADVDFDVGVLEADAHAGEVFLGDADDGLFLLVFWTIYLLVVREGSYLVNVAENSLLDTLVLDDLAENTAVTTADDKDLLRVGVGVHGEVGDHFLVSTKKNRQHVNTLQGGWKGRDAREFIALSALNDIVQDQDSAVVAALEDENVLVLRFLVVEDFLDLEGHGLAGPHVRGLGEPAIYERFKILVR